MAKSKQARVAAKEDAKKSAAPTIDNRRARHEYHILDSLEAGLALTGTEVKSIRAGGVSITEAYARLRDGEMWLLGMHVPPYKQGSFSNVDPNRPRKLLLHKEQMLLQNFLIQLNLEYLMLFHPTLILLFHLQMDL